MIFRLFNKYTQNFVSAWLILLFDLFLVVFLYLFAILIRFNFSIDASLSYFSIYQIPYVVLVSFIGFFVFKPYEGVIRHTALNDMLRIFLSLFLGFFVFALVTYVTQQTNRDYWTNIPFSVILIHFLLGAFVLVNTRLVVKTIYYQLMLPSRNTHVLIYGVGALGVITKNLLSQGTTTTYRIIGFIDDHPKKQGKKVDGVRVYAPDDVLTPEFIEKENIKEMVIAIQNISAQKKRDIANRCLNLNVKVRFASSVENWLGDSGASARIKDVRIEDLLGRDCIELSKENIQRGLQDEIIMITGAAGSIGSEIVRQVVSYKPKKVIMVDQAETAMNDTMLEISGYIRNGMIEGKICDVNNRKRMDTIFAHYRPTLIFHAAAYKHVPLMEENPYEAAHVNIGGTKNIADLSVKYGVKKMVMISTDKAVNPANIMGATKRLAEKYCRSVGKTEGRTDFIITRFGNVLGSNGSVIPLFRKQIEAGGPVTVTHKEITRYFMTIPEACQLVLEAAFMGKEGEIYLFDMGESVKIYDLAKKMIQLSGLTLGKDIDIKFTGLRKGEKLYEELLASKEGTQETHHPKILIGKVSDYDHTELIKEVNGFLQEIETLKDTRIYDRLVSLVPEYISSNQSFRAITE